MCRPQEGHARRPRFGSNRCFFRPLKYIVQPTPIMEATSTVVCGSGVVGLCPPSRRASLRSSGVRMGVRLEVQFAAAPVGYVRVQLRGREVGVAEHLLDASEVCPALEQVGGE